MPRESWLLVGGRPALEIVLGTTTGATGAQRILLADTGAGTNLGGMDLVLSEADRRRFSAGNEATLRIGGAYTGNFPTFWVPVAIPGLGFFRLCLAVAVPSPRLPRPLQGIACFRFLNRFTYGNFGDPGGFSLELP